MLSSEVCLGNFLRKLEKKDVSTRTEKQRKIELEFEQDRIPRNKRDPTDDQIQKKLRAAT